MLKVNNKPDKFFKILDNGPKEEQSAEQKKQKTKKDL